MLNKAQKCSEMLNNAQQSSTMPNNSQQSSTMLSNARFLFACLSPIPCCLPVSLNNASNRWLAMLKNALQNYLYLENLALTGIVEVNSMFSLVLCEDLQHFGSDLPLPEIRVVGRSATHYRNKTLLM